MTFTKEQLIAAAHGRIDFANMMLSDNPEPLKERTWAIELRLAEIALAALDAQHVGYIDAEYADLLKLGSVESCSVYAEPGEGFIAVYTAPPAPVVPDAMEPVLKDGEIIAYERHGERFSTVAGAAWNACRAAILQGAEPVKVDLTLREGLAAIRNSGIAIDAEKIQAERDALNDPDVPDGYALVPVELLESLRSSAHFEKASYAASFGSHIDTGRWKDEYEELEKVCTEIDQIIAAVPQKEA